MYVLNFSWLVFLKKILDLVFSYSEQAGCFISQIWALSCNSKVVWIEELHLSLSA